MMQDAKIIYWLLNQLTAKGIQCSYDSWITSYYRCVLLYGQRLFSVFWLPRSKTTCMSSENGATLLSSNVPYLCIYRYTYGHSYLCLHSWVRASWLHVYGASPSHTLLFIYPFLRPKSMWGMWPCDMIGTGPGIQPPSSSQYHGDLAKLYQWVYHIARNINGN